MPKAPAVKWTREHQLIALNLYYKLPFGKYDKETGVIKQVAAKMGRTSSSLAMKLGNFASFDPVLRARGIQGMPGASKSDRQMWDEFQLNLPDLAPTSEKLLHDLMTKDEEVEVDLLRPESLRLERVKVSVPPEETEVQTIVRVRRGQHFFRQAVLSAYGVRCCISGINLPELLVASHIKPWREFPKERLDPSNGLCLSNLHDRAFDAGLITVDKQFKVVLSRRIRGHFSQPTLEQNFAPFDRKMIRLPEKLAQPSEEYLRYHRETIFER